MQQQCYSKLILNFNFSKIIIIIISYILMLTKLTQ